VPPRAPRVVVVGLGPAGPELVPDATRTVLAEAGRVFLRTRRHPAASVVGGEAVSFDDLYETAASFDDVYRAIVDTLVDAASALAAGAGAEGATAYVAYAVPGSPLLAERTVTLLRADARIALQVVPAPSFADLAWDRLALDPVEVGARLVVAAVDRGPVLVAQCHNRDLLSSVKLAVERPPAEQAVLLHHLGLADEVVRAVEWADIDRTLEPDHLTALWVPARPGPAAEELVALEELVRVLRARCPWDREQTHGSLGRHLLEESYETLDAIEALERAEPDVAPELVAHLEEELGDLLFQVVFHAQLGAEEGRFTLADVARTVHDKLVSRHPHVFGDARADTPEQVAARWEQLKKKEKGRTSVTEGIPAALPALALAAKLQRKAESVGIDLGPAEARRAAAAGMLAALPLAGHSGETLPAGADEAEAVGELLFAVADLARRSGVDPETALRSHAERFRRHVENNE